MADPTDLGRGVVIRAGAEPPAAWAGAARVRITEDLLAAPAPAVAELHGHWLERRPVVVELDIAEADLRSPPIVRSAPWELGAGFAIERERLQFLVWANNWDARSGEPIWWWARKASRLGAEVGGPADIVLPDGHAVLVDGGPREPLDGASVIHRESIEAGRLTLARWRAPAAALAPDQLAAVTHARGAARIIAPAGSGKTRVLTERLRHLLEDRGWEPSCVAAVAFNKRAADEMLARTAGLGAHVRTINALGLAILSGGLGGPPPARRPQVIDEHEVRRVLDSLVDVRRQANTDVLAPYVEALSAIRIGLRSPQQAEADYPDAEGLAEVWPRYCDALERAGVIDFDAQIDGAIRRLLTEPEVRAAVQVRCRHLLVDEFQDLAPAHMLLLRLAAAPVYDVFGVGDDDQVIYGYAGATPSYLIDFETWFPGAGRHELEVNYRCPEEVVAGARHLLEYNAKRIPKQMRTPPGTAAGELRVTAVQSEEMAAAAVAEVQTSLAAGAAARDIAVLCRVNSALLPVQVALGVAGVPTTLPVDRRVLERTGVRTALAWLRLGLHPDRISRSDVQETVRRPSRRLARNVVEMLTKRQRTSAGDIRVLAGRLSGGDVDKLLGYADDIDAVARAIPKGTAAALRAIRTKVGLGSAMDGLDASRSEADRSTHGDDLRALEMVAALHPDAATFAGWLSDRLSEPASGGDDVVTLSTVHRVKGQEWPVVIVFGVHAELFPHRLSSDVEEERRVFHVAITRAGSRTVVLSDAGAPSPFVSELDGSRPKTPVRPQLATKALPAVAAANRPTPSGAADSPAFEALRAWRRETASRAKVSPFIVLPDACLRDVAERRPTTITELKRCWGMGPRKIEQYGDEILAVLDSVATAGA